MGMCQEVVVEPLGVRDLLMHISYLLYFLPNLRQKLIFPVITQLKPDSKSRK